MRISKKSSNFAALFCTNMSSLIHIDEEYRLWIQSLSKRFRQSQIKAAVHINQDTLRFYWELGKEIVELHSEQRWGSKFFANLSRDLKDANPGAGCFSETNLLYMKNFYLLYSPIVQITPRSGEQMAITPQLGEQIFSIPWGHHKLLIDKCKGQPDKAIFYVQQTIANGWSRDMLLNIYSTDLYERHSKAITNFTQTLPDEQSDLARDITRDPYSFSFTGLREPFNERKLKDALIANIEKFLIELGTGFAYMGREVRLQVGETEQFLDMLFYNIRLHCYVVVEVKTTDFEAAHIGQLGAYVVAVDHILRTESDNKTIGLLICKTKDNIFAQYALEATNQPLGISEYELQKLYPTQVKGTMPTIEEIENELNETYD